MRNSSSTFPKNITPTYVKPGEMIKSSKNQQLAAKLTKESLCVVFYGWYETGGGLRFSTPDVCLLHWNKNNASDPPTSLEYLLHSVATPSPENPTRGLGSGYKDIKVYIVSHPENDLETEKQVYDKLLEGLPELQISQKHKKHTGQINRETITCMKMDHFMVNSNGQPVVLSENQNLVKDVTNRPSTDSQKPFTSRVGNLINRLRKK